MAEKNVKFYKTKDGTIVVCKDEFARQQIEQLQGIWEAIEELPDGQAVSAQVAIHTTEIAALQSGKANINGSYDSMTVGMAKNVEATSEISGTSLYRPTAGNADVADGVARVLKIGGNAFPWNQLVNPSIAVALYCTAQFSNGTYQLTSTSAYQEMMLRYDIPLIKGHKYYQGLRLLSNNIHNYYFQVQNENWQQVYRMQLNQIFLFDDDSTIQHLVYCVSRNSTEEVTTAEILCPFLFDLTSKYGAGNEPTSPADFEADYMREFGKPLTYEPYNPGKLLAAKLLGLRTVWLNQWDEQWEVGTLDAEGNPASSNNTIRSKNYIPVIPNLSYYFRCGMSIGSPIYFFDSNKAYLTSNVAARTNQIFNVPSGARYMKFRLEYPVYGTTYNHDICINLHYTNGRDGEYAPYVEHEYNFDTSKVYGKLNGEGNYVQVFPDGMKSAGSVRDELIIIGGAAKATKRVGSVDLGTLTWSYYENNQTFRGVNITDIKIVGPASAIPNLLCNKYLAANTNNFIVTDKTITVIATTQIIGVKDLSYTDAATFKAAMNGVMLYYELATPLHYTDLVYRDNGVDTPIDALNIQVSNYGTEEQIVESPTNGEPNSCAATLDILYGVNAADFIDAANNGSFISKPSQDALLSTLSAALGGTLSATWNEATGHYDYTFTQNRQSNEEPHDD